MATQRISMIALSAAIAGCGSGGGGTTPVAVAAATTPQPPPPPPPLPPATSGFDTSEYRATAGAVAMNALAAYRAGATGGGVRVAVIDSGLAASSSSQFAGRIDPASAALAGNATLEDASGHGTAVAEILAAGRDGVGVHGIAFDATLVIFRTDIPGTCARGDCIYRLAAVAEAFDRARVAGARVINLSMVGDNPPTPELFAALDRATEAGMVVAVCAGNDSIAVQRWAADMALSPEARGQVVVAGFVNGSGNPLGSPAGAVAAHFLSATAGSCSAGTPMIAGALALLAQGNPGLSGAALVERLYASARDAGQPGLDPVHGRGIVDLTRAFP